MITPWLLVVMFVSLFVGTLAPAADTPDQKPKADYVVLVHGMSRSHLSMIPMGAQLQWAGYTVRNVRYASHKGTVEELSQELAEVVRTSCPDRSRNVHFVTHSLGGILVRAYLNTEPDIQVGRVVMLGPPNQGSEIVDSLRQLAPYRWFTGPVGSQLGTGPDSVPLQLGPVTAETGVIAGTRVLNPLLSQPLGAESDGKVTVERTKVDGMADHISIHASHTWMMNKPEVVQQTKHFLAHGRFNQQKDHYQAKDQAVHPQREHDLVSAVNAETRALSNPVLILDATL